MRKNYLLAPGPTPVPENALLAMAQPMIHHRTPQFSQIFAEVKSDLKYLFQTEQDVLILASSGTGAMEGSVTNLLSPGDEVVVVNGGKFGERWGKISEAYGIKVHWISVEWGEAVAPPAVKEVLDGNPRCKGRHGPGQRNIDNGGPPDKGAGQRSREPVTTVSSSSMGLRQSASSLSPWTNGVSTSSSRAPRRPSCSPPDLPSPR